MNQILIAIASGKGGVGKSTLTAALAHSLIGKGHAVGVLDFDFYGPSQSRLLPYSTAPHEEGEWVIPGLSGEIELLSIASQGAFVRSPIANGFVDQMLKRVKWRSAEFVLIDLPPGTGDIHLTTFQLGDIKGVVVVTTPQMLAFDDVDRSMLFFEKMGVPVLGVIENMFDLFPGSAGEMIAEKWSVPLLEKIGFDRKMAESADCGALLELDSVASKLLEMHLGSSVRLHPQKIVKCDKGNFEILWSDGVSQRFDAAFIEAHCPCALCKGQRKPQRSDVQACRLQVIGTYAMQFMFSSGCHHGIYSFDLLRSLGQ